MLDMLGREVDRGDIIVYGALTLSGFNRFTETRLGVVSKVIAGGKQYVVKDRQGLPILDGITGQPYMQTVLPKITYYPLHVQTINPLNVKLTKHGKRKYNPYLSMNFIKINKEDLTEDYLKIYDEVCRSFRI